MTITTEAHWSINGVPLNTYAYNVATLGDDLLAPPPLRGDNFLVPHAFGERHLPKVPDGVTKTFVMWVQGANPDGTVPANPSQKFLDNFRMLRKLMWHPYTEVLLTRRFRDENNVLRTATAKAQFVSGLAPQMTGGARAAFVVDFRLANPFFYEPVNAITLANGLQTITHAGDGISRRMTVKINGSRNALTLFNRTNGVSVSYNDTVASGQSVTLDVEAFTAKNQSGVSMISSVTHAGAPAWFELASGANQIELVGTGTGTVVLTFENAWI